MKIAVIHDWLVTYAGAERVLEQILILYPGGDLYSLIDFLPIDERYHILGKKAQTSFIQKLPFARANYRNYLPIMPFTIERFDLSQYDLILSSSHAVAKGVRTRPGQLHICYCHTPMRYAWDLREQYLVESGLDRGAKGLLSRWILGHIRKWDFATSDRISHFIANSAYIADRIKRCYGRDSTVIYPPVDVDAYSLHEDKDDFYLTASRMVPYKKTDLIVDAFSTMPDKRLVVIGDGPHFDKVKGRAGRNVELIGYQPASKMKDYYQKAKAFIYAAEEDFGIVTVEAQACGTPVIAFGRGGSLETIIPLKLTEIKDQKAEKEPTGVFFYEQNVDALKNAILMFEKNQDKFDGKCIRKNALRFSVERFRKEFKNFVDKTIDQRFA